MEKYFNRLNNTFHGVIAGPLLVFVYMYLQLDKGGFEAPYAGKDYVFLSLTSFVLYVAYTYWLFKNYKLAKFKLVDKGSLSERLEAFRLLTIRLYIMMTLPALYVVVAMILTGEMSFGLIYFVQLFVMSVYRPSVHNICKGLNLKGEEREFVLKKKEFSEEGGIS